MRRRFLAPEVVQTSALDCGPAALKALLEGFGVPAGYDRLREACQTDLDGTSIDTIEEVAAELGMAAEQVMVPRDHLARDPGTLPAIVVVRLPQNLTHFVLVWRRVGPFFQIVDPGTVGAGSGAPLPRRRLPPSDGGRGKLEGLGRVVRREESSRDGSPTRASVRPGWSRTRRNARAGNPGDADAAARLTDTLVARRAIRRGAEADRFLRGLLTPRRSSLLGTGTPGLWPTVARTRTRSSTVPCSCGLAPPGPRPARPIAAEAVTWRRPSARSAPPPSASFSAISGKSRQ